MPTTTYANKAQTHPGQDMDAGHERPITLPSGEFGRTIWAISIAAALTYLHVGYIGFTAASAVCAFLALTVMAFEIIPPLHAFQRSKTMAHKSLQPALLVLVLAVFGTFASIAHSHANADTAIVPASTRDADAIMLRAVDRDLNTDLGPGDAMPNHRSSGLSAVPGFDGLDWLNKMHRLFDRAEEETFRHFGYFTDRGNRGTESQLAWEPLPRAGVSLSERWRKPVQGKGKNMEFLAQTSLLIVSVYGAMIAACYAGVITAGRGRKTFVRNCRASRPHQHMPEHARLSAASLA